MTARAVVAGLLVGALVCVANLYTGLQVGFFDSGHVTAAILAYALASSFRGGEMSRLENNTAQTLAAAAAAIPGSAGLIGAIPAMSLLHLEPAAWPLAFWALAIAVVGTLLALAMRRRLLDQERLPFPTGIATAEVIEALHGDIREARGRTRALLVAAVLAGAIGWFRQGTPAWIPSELLLPIAIAGIPAGALTLGLSTSPLLLGVGTVTGLRAGVSVLAGGLLAWAVAAPVLVKGDLGVPLEYRALSQWLAWPGVAMLVGAGMVSVARQARAVTGALRDLASFVRGRQRRMDRQIAAGVALGLVACVAVIAAARTIFGLGPVATMLALVLSLPLANACARTAGLTDISPYGSFGQLAQAAFGLFLPGRPGLNLAAGAVVGGNSAQAVGVLWSMRAGRALGASPARMGIAAIAGTVLGAFVAVPVYELLVRTHGIASARMPTPSALQWKALAEVLAKGAGALPPGTVPAVLVCGALGIVLALLGTSRASRWIPTPFAMGVGALIPAHVAAGIACGAALIAIVSRYRPQLARNAGVAAGAGAIAGESIVGLAVAVLVSAGVLGH